MNNDSKGDASIPATEEMLKIGAIATHLTTIEANQRAILQGQAIILALIAKGTTELSWLEKLAAISERELPKVSADVSEYLKQLSASLKTVRKGQKG